MIAVSVKLAVNPGREADFEDAFAAQAAAVRRNEPGNCLYELFRSHEYAGTYMLMEIYADEAALAAHRQSEHMAEHREKTVLFVSGEPEIETFSIVDHTVRCNSD
ncbi:antibiotic biosynthesis monooxygenase [Agrobacterium larrymoorei]|uniref:putative quinol monooxygenase n=1 Tax=Rhizobium/Agrobacterium group TaxID=227290 RepID=UPI001440E709|nr:MULTISPECIES: putative quinol monooxygenase [Rhizobium/Agrobacterium group]NKM57748.1 antibiotic biosynthesis monooxygenase [Rhizobium anhuiense]NTJ44948.1 antibiotic biosynthesis monooxygenase [Agrobacterium larrymoorei]